MAIKTEEQKRLNKEYIDTYNYTLSEIVDFYKELSNEAKNDSKKLAILNSTQVFSDKFETPMYNHLSRTYIHKMIKEYVQGEHDLFDVEADDYHSERIEQFNDYVKKISRVFLTLDKRVIDWIIRQQKITRQIQESIIRVQQLNFRLKNNDIKKISIKLRNAGIRYTESQLDLITLKAIQELLPMKEMELFIKQYDQHIEELMQQWNSYNRRMYMKNGTSIGIYLRSNFFIAKKIYKIKFDLLETEDKFFDNIDGYSGEFLDTPIIKQSIFKEGDVYDKSR